MPTTFDRRELVLERLAAILSGLNIPILGGPEPAKVTLIPAGNFVRNRNELGDKQVPGIILLDADEVQVPYRRPERGQIERGVPDTIMKMTPEIYVVLDVRGITNENVGQDLNAARLAILSAVLPDQELQKIVGSNGDVCYDGSVTDLARNRTMKGQLGISLTFKYPLRLTEYRGV